jgi:hypothetical protein
VKKKDLIRKAKYALWIPRKITRNPKVKGSVISDLFPLRSDSQWQTHFELLNVAGLISGDNVLTQEKHARFIFFDGEGEKLGEKLITVPSSGRKTVFLNSELDPSISSHVSSFAVFHESQSDGLDIGESFLAERGYTGYCLSSSAIRGYVHGNFDSLSYKDGKIKAIGNKGLLTRLYTVQHPLRGPATYEFFLSNPTPRPVSVKVLHGDESKEWSEIERFKLKSKGSCIFRVEKKDEGASFIRIRSKFYLGRPVVFRISGLGLDVFHG